MIGIIAGVVGLIAGILLHRRIVAEDLKLAVIVKKLVGAKVAAAKLAEIKVGEAIKQEVTKVKKVHM